MDTKLSHRLIDLGFFSALGTTEHPGKTKAELLVGRADPHRWEYNNGVVCVWDELGRPWLMPAEFPNRNSRLNRAIDKMREEFALKRGGFVPHSNDGGTFLRAVIEPRVTENIALLAW